jgi:predicted KAP-like P-loop ATPase
MSDAIPNTAHRWDADRPGERPEDDLLSRKDFAQRVAKELRAWHQKDSLVVSLNGDWGSGKTTLANLIIYYIAEQAKKAEETKPTVVKFNPWQWSGQEKLLEGFFEEIGAAFRSRERSLVGKIWAAICGRKTDELANAGKLAAFWDGLKAVTVVSGELATKLQDSITAGAAMLAGGSGVLSGYVRSELGKTVLCWTGVVLLGIASVSAVYAPMAEKLAEFFHWKTKGRHRTLDQVRSDLKEELKTLVAPLIIVIDDIDRLTKREVRLLVQLVKANADFPNVVYLLLYQKSVVADALEGITGKNGQDFLKKIVQVELEVPFPPEHEMRSLFMGQIEPVLGRAVIRPVRDRWGRLFNDVIWPHFRTPRDIKRFNGMLDFYYEAHVIDGVLEVNAIDLVLIEILRMFDPVAYEAVSRAFQKQRSIFLQLSFGDTEAKKEFVLAVKKLVERQELEEDQSKRLRALLIELFPQAQETAVSSGEQ